MGAIGYIRQSRRADQDAALSRSEQLEAIRRLAERDGRDPAAVEIHEDLGRSGGAGKERHRPGYLAVVAAVEGGSVDTIYSLSLTRLARSVPELYRLLHLAEEHGVRIVLAHEGPLDPRSPMGRAQFGMMAVFAEFERDLARERARENVAERRARGERMGHPFYGDRPGDDPGRVAAAYREAGTLSGAAAVLNAAGFPAYRGGRWTIRSVRLVLERLAPDELPRNEGKGRRPVPPFMFARLVRCGHKDGFLTGRHWGASIGYHCHRAATDRSHPKPAHVLERTLIDWAKGEAARFRPPEAVVLEQDRQAAARDKLAADRVVIDDMYLANGPTWRNEYRRRLAVLKADEDALDAAEAVRTIAVPQAIDWERWAPEDVNQVLRALWSEVRLDAEMRPVKAEWRVPEWRSA